MLAGSLMRNRSARNTKAEIARDLNDAFRKTFVGGIVVIERDLAGMKPEVKARVMEAVRDYTGFDSENDPDGDHRSGAVKIGLDQFSWKIEYYNRTLSNPSVDPADPNVTARVLTIRWNNRR